MTVVTSGMTGVRPLLGAATATAAGYLLGNLLSYPIAAGIGPYVAADAAVTALLLAVAVLAAAPAAGGVGPVLRPVLGLAAAAAVGQLVLGYAILLRLRATIRPLLAETDDGPAHSALLRVVLPVVGLALAAAVLLRRGGDPLLPSHRPGPLLVLPVAGSAGTAQALVAFTGAWDQQRLAAFDVGALVFALAVWLAGAWACGVRLDDVLTLLGGAVLLSVVGLVAVLTLAIGSPAVRGLHDRRPPAAVGALALVGTLAVRRTAGATEG